MAGMGNVVLQPQYTIGTSNDITFKALPNWHNHIDLSAIYGNALTGNGASGKDFQEIHGKIMSLYTVYNSNDVLMFNTGLYSLFADPLHNYPSYLNLSSNVEYAAEENEKLNHEELLGWDFDFEINYDKSVSSIHNIVYFSGQRIAPNILSYKPVMGFDWHHEIFLWGDKDKPKFSIFGDAQFWFARKEGVGVINSHDGIGATKREFYLAYGVSYFFTKKTAIYLESYGFNNLNRGTSTTEPIGFRDGSVFGIRHTF
jgi:hypothetical protein